MSENSGDPYAVVLAEGETVVREGWALRYDRIGYHGATGFSMDPLLARLDSRLRAPSYGGKAEPVHITVIRTPERRELVDLGDFDGWVGETFCCGSRTTETIGRDGIGWRPFRLIPGTERAVVRRLVPGPVVETP